MEDPKLPLLGFFCDIDLFGRNVDIYYKGKPQRYSWIGRILTLLYIGIYLFFFIYRVIRMTNKEDVTFYDTYAFSGEPPIMQLNNEIFYSGVSLVHPLTGAPFVDPSIYRVKISYISGIKDGFSFKNVETELPLEICQLNKFGKNYKEFFSKKDLNNYYCVKNFSQILQGHQTYDVYSYYNIQFFPCVNTSENNNICKPKAYLEKILNKFGVTFSMQDIDLTPKDYENPVKYRLKELTLLVESSMYMDVHSYWQVVNIETDEDIFGLGTSNNIRKEKYLKYDQAVMLYSLNKLNLDNPNSPLISCTVGLSEKELTETRTYPKLIAVIGDVGGFMEVIFSLFSVLATALTETLYIKSLVNHLFSFDLDKKLILVKKNDTKLFKSQKSLQIYTPDKLLKTTIINVNKKNNGKEENKENKSKNKTISNNINNNNKDNSILKQKTKEAFIKTRQKSSLSKKVSYNSIFDINSKTSKLSKDNGNFFHESNRKLDSKLNSIIEKNFNEDIKDTEKESNFNKDNNILINIELNQFKPKFCYKEKKEHIEKILLDEAMKIILVKLDVQNLFKKIYKEESNTEEINSEYEFIEMSGYCKKELAKILDKQNRTLVI